MKTPLKLVLALSLLISLSFKNDTDTIYWNTILEKAIDSSRTNSKPIIIYFGASWCGPCKIVEQKVFRDPEFIKYTKDFLMVKIYDDFKKSDTLKYRYYSKVKSQYQVEAIPTFIVLIKNRRPCKLEGAYSNANELIQEIKNCR